MLLKIMKKSIICKSNAALEKCKISYRSGVFSSTLKQMVDKQPRGLLCQHVPVVAITISSYKNPCDIHLKHVLLAELNLWQNPAFKVHQILFCLG